MTKHRIHVSVYLDNGNIIPFKSYLRSTPWSDDEIEAFISAPKSGMSYFLSGNGKYGMFPSVDKISAIVATREEIEE